MQEFCPVCSKNGVKARIKAYQLNLQEAVLMCATEKCTFPVGHQELTFINRPVGKDWSATWDETSSKYLKSDTDLLLELSTYTPPQTPGTEGTCKDVASFTTCSTTVPDKVFNSMSTLIEDNVHTTQEFSTIISKPCDSPIDNSINSMNLKPKLVVSKQVNYKLEKLPTKGYVFKKNNESNGVLSKSSNNLQLKNFKNNIQTNVSTSVASKNVVNNIVVKDEKSSSNLSTMNGVRSKVKGSLRKFNNKKKTKTCPYEKFDFNELLKAKSTNIKKECKVVVTKIEKTEKKPKECIKVLDEKACSFDDFDFSEYMSTESVSMKSECNNANVADLVRTNVAETSNNSQVDFDSILALTNSSKDSGVDHDLLENGDLDLHLEDLLAGFSDEISNNTYKSDMNDSEDCKWINSLFE